MRIRVELPALPSAPSVQFRSGHKIKVSQIEWASGMLQLLELPGALSARPSAKTNASGSPGTAPVV